jgi:hypothetical protein
VLECPQNQDLKKRRRANRPIPGRAYSASKILYIDFKQLEVFENRMSKNADRTKAERIDFVGDRCGEANALSAD